jgi:hypothetical protein
MMELVRKCTEGQQSGSGSGLDKNRRPETDIQMERKRMWGEAAGWMEDVRDYWNW